MSFIAAVALATACLAASSGLVSAVAVICSVKVVTGTMLISSRKWCSSMIPWIPSTPSLCVVLHLYAAPQDVVPASGTGLKLSGLLRTYRIGTMQDSGSELRRIPLLRLSEKGCEQHSERGFGRRKEAKMGRKVPLRCSVRLHRSLAR